MTIQEMSNEELDRQYAGLLIEIENKYVTKKEFEVEYKRRLREGLLKGGQNGTSI